MMQLLCGLRRLGQYTGAFWSCLGSQTPSLTSRLNVGSFQIGRCFVGHVLFSEIVFEWVNQDAFAAFCLRLISLVHDGSAC
jgi:hypothetical protein